MLFDLLRLAGGGVLLYLGAEGLVGGSSALARRLGMSPLVVGLTVVAYGTSMPELVVSGLAALEGHSAIALGNVVGSNIANLGLILGLTALISPPQVEGSLIRREVPVLVGTALLVPALLWDGRVDRLEGTLLLLGAVAFTVWTLRATRHGAAVALPAVAATAPERGLGAIALLCLGGLLGLVGGGKLLVDGATGIALAAGMSERVVGLTIVAIGTSLPELAASVVAALRGQSSLAIGNVIGSNIFNVLLILGASAAINPVEGSLPLLRVELGMLLLTSLAAAVVLRSPRRVARVEGAIFAASYLGFLAFLALG